MKYQSQKNLLLDYIYNNQMKQASEQTIKGLLRAIVEPVVDAGSEGVVLFRLFNKEGLDGLLKRLEFSNAGIYHYCDCHESAVDVCENNIWGQTEFAIVLAPRYSAALVWDYSQSEVEGYSNITFYVNSRKIHDVLKIVIDNSKIDFMPDVEPYSLERRENELMVSAVHKVVDYLNDIELEHRLCSIAPQEDGCSAELRNVIHEIRNNLSVIDLHTRIIEKNAEKLDNKDCKDSVLKAKEAVERALELIHRQLDELREEIPLEIREHDIEALVKIALELVRPEFEDKNIEIETNLKNFGALADETRLLHVLLNILKNAICALGKNGKLRVSLEETESGYNRILVENNGAKIPQELFEKIFEENFTTKTGGSGLGLKISKDAMRAMSGDLRLVKSDDNSTIFEIVLNAGGTK